ncbi:uncharacterized protein BP5553_07527 [Venustampulla echinocandica]|uniref:Uncharacterized protein n=1 Tax=Venustampulla echinocandica TaxID=2656787 RepID=A0A370TGS0_9HELO|nr:uncharacterized protein BP5553_07527 [Venustampulla echinocandica]RDL34399.1 hypothetical protein BP5553_07527 [Venustampulla echinocandica]
MCCWPWTEIYLEDEPKKESKDKKKEDKGALYYDPVSRTTVRLTGVPHITSTCQLTSSTMTEQNIQPQVRDTAAGALQHTYIPRADGTVLIGNVVYVPVAQGLHASQQPMIYPAPFMPHPQPAYQPYMMPSQSYTPTPGLQPFTNQQPAFGYFGYTGSEMLAQHLATAQGLGMNKKQDMKPADDDPHRFYWVREFDNTWSQRSRMTIDSGDIGECRWYAKDGEFYAVRLQS